jgi:hypothetical protein
MDRAFYRESVDESGLKKRSSTFTNGTRVPIWNARTVGIFHGDSAKTQTDRFSIR